MLDPNHTCLNVGLCRHVWVVVGKAVAGYGHLSGYDCPRCDTSKHRVWVWSALVGGDPKKRSAHSINQGA